jgi:hypothetical protein
VRQIARALGIPGPIERVRALEDVGARRVMSTWVVVRGESGPNLHSIAISMRTGRVIYHGGSLDSTHPGAAPGPSDVAAREAAEHFLIQFGWPASRLVPGPPFPLPYRDPHLTYASFWWSGAAPADLPASAFYVGHGPLVKEGLMLPPVKDSTELQPRSIDDAWKQVQSGSVPVGLEQGVDVLAARGVHAQGTGRVLHVTVTYVVTPSSSGALYLVPAYRFSGPAHFPGVTGIHTWVAIVPAL